MKGTIPIVLFFTAAVAAGILQAAPTPANALLVLEKEQNSLVIVDPVNLQIVARVPAGRRHHRLYLQIAAAGGSRRLAAPIWTRVRKRKTLLHSRRIEGGGAL
jgi:hypothetical protein